MADIFRPWRRRQLPAWPFKIDWNHPLANGLISCVVPGYGFVDLAVAGVTLAPDAGTAGSISVAASGVGWNSSPDTSGLYVNAPPTLQPSTYISVFWMGAFVANTNATGYASLFGVNFTASPTTHFHSCELVRNYLGGNQAKMSLLFSLGTAFDDNIDSTSAIDTSNYGRIYSFAGSLRSDASIGHANLYADGQNVATKSAGTYLNGIQYGTTPVYEIGGTVDARARGVGAVTSIGCIWNRELSDQEMQAMDAAPFAFLIPVEGEWPSLMAVSPPPPPPAFVGGTLPMMGV